MILFSLKDLGKDNKCQELYLPDCKKELIIDILINLEKEKTTPKLLKEKEAQKVLDCHSYKYTSSFFERVKMNPSS